MKKLFFYMTMMLAAVMLTTSCSSDDDSLSAEDAAKFLTSGYWQGYSIKQRKEWGSYRDQADRTWNVVRFDRATPTALNGTGRQLGFKTEYMNNDPEVSNFRWRIEGDIVTIAYEQWGTATFNYKEITLNNDRFAGFQYETDDVRYQFDYRKDAFSKWEQYNR
jgi:hypothetical protein